MTNFHEYAEHLKEAGIDALGMLCWYHVPEAAAIEHKDFLRLVEGSGAPIKLPELPKPGDVFRRACNTAKMLKVQTADPNVFHNYTMRDSGYDDGFVFRTMIEEKVDAGNHKLGFRELGLAAFAKASMKATFDYSIDDDDDAMPFAKQMAEGIDVFIRQRMLTITAIAVRESARKAIENTLVGTKVRPGGGVYFVAMDHTAQLEALAHVINNVDGCSMHILPLVDDERQRGRLKEAFQDESIEETTRMVAEIAELLQDPDAKVTTSKFVMLRDKFKVQKERQKIYEEILSDNLSLSQAALEVAQKQLKALLDKAT